MSYVDGYLIPIPKKNLASYTRMAKVGCKVWMDHGAIGYRECVGDDLAVKMGIPFPKQIRVKKGETVVFSWIVFKSKAHRDKVNKAVMKDPRLLAMMQEMTDPKKMPFDYKRMSYGGFKTLVSA